MKRMFGLIAAKDVKIEKHFRDPHGLPLFIQAADGGYSILFADSSTESSDNEKSATENYKMAYDRLTEIFGEIVEDEEDEYVEYEDRESEDGDEEEYDDKEYEKLSKVLDAMDKVRSFVNSCAEADSIVKIKDGKSFTMDKKYVNNMKEAADYISSKLLEL